MTVMLIISSMFLIGFLFGWYTGFNIYKIIFLEAVLILIFIILINIEISVTGNANASVAQLQQGVRGSFILHIISGVAGMFSGMYLKHKSLQMVEEIKQ